MHRAKLLLKLIFSDKDKAEQAYDALIPSYHTEVYVLYNILKSANVLESCDVTMPCIPTNKESLNVDIMINDVERNNVTKIINNDNGVFKPFKNNKSVNVTAESKSSGLSLILVLES